MKKIILLLLLCQITLSQDIDFAKIKGWTAADSVSNYNPSNLWEYINGAADLFILFGFQNLQSCEISSGDIEVVVDVYNMENALNAFGIYKTERGENQALLSIGSEAVITSPHQCLMLKDKFYIKLNVYEGQLSEEKAKLLLTSFAEILPGTNKYPNEFDLLPQTNKIKNSEHFVKESYLGLSDLKNILYAEYESGIQYFSMIVEANQEPDKIWQQLSSKWKTAELDDFPVLYRKIPYKGMVGIIKTASGIFGINNSKTENELLERLKVFIKK